MTEEQQNKIDWKWLLICGIPFVLVFFVAIGIDNYNKSVTSQISVLSDLNATNTKLDSVLNNQQIIFNGVIALQEQRLCGQAQLIQDSNETVTVPDGTYITYKCALKVG